MNAKYQVLLREVLSNILEHTLKTRANEEADISRQCIASV